MVKWIIAVAVVLYFSSSYYQQRFMAKEGRDERGKMIVYKSRSMAFPYILGAWGILYWMNGFLHLSYSQFQNAIAFIVVGVNLIQFSYLIMYRHKY